ncbi:hypothetical protein HYPSUDRAFT_197831 [Hypholoma sublateritium FD-334 SS-4]|uniref:Uncharacterized protein n=1 Tax=Hypholoma sublateritium (strain FD-334 SS-4) TaxID=945553 RepID=A0A0D2MUH1_HYPSF|nr:hypothetical protein HYPSUDRAFT_197831 [Hypholoma sublateritium FD-334 SS-4]
MEELILTHYPGCLYVLEGTNGVTFVALSPDGKHIAPGLSDKTVRIWDLETGKQVGEPFRGHTDRVNSVAFSPDGRRVVSGSGDETLRIWDLEPTGKQISEPWKGHTSLVMSVAFSPDGKCVVSGSRDNTVRIWNSEVGEPLQGHTSAVWSVAFSPDGKRIASGSLDATVRVWDSETGTQIGAPLQGHTGPVLSVAFSPDGKHIASGSGDDTVRIWDSETEKQVEGKYIVSGSDDKTVRIWDVETGKRVGELFRGHTDEVMSVAFSPDGKRVVSGSLDNTIRIWDAEMYQAANIIVLATSHGDATHISLPPSITQQTHRAASPVRAARVRSANVESSTLPSSSVYEETRQLIIVVDNLLHTTLRQTPHRYRVLVLRNAHRTIERSRELVCVHRTAVAPTYAGAAHRPSAVPNRSPGTQPAAHAHPLHARAAQHHARGSGAHPHSMKSGPDAGGWVDKAARAHPAGGVTSLSAPLGRRRAQLRRASMVKASGAAVQGVRTDDTRSRGGTTQGIGRVSRRRFPPLLDAFQRPSDISSASTTKTANDALWRPEAPSVPPRRRPSLCLLEAPATYRSAEFAYSVVQQRLRIDLTDAQPNAPGRLE